MLQSTIVPGPGGQRADVDVLLADAAAGRDHQQLRTDYRRHDAHSRRMLEPHRMVGAR